MQDNQSSTEQMAEAGSAWNLQQIRARFSEIKIKFLRFLEEEMFIRLSKNGWDGKGDKRERLAELGRAPSRRSHSNRRRVARRDRSKLLTSLPNVDEYLARTPLPVLPNGGKSIVFQETDVKPSSVGNVQMVGSEESRSPQVSPPVEAPILKLAESSSGEIEDFPEIEAFYVSPVIRTFKATASSISLPALTSLEDLEKWAADYIPEKRLYITKKAFKAAAISTYSDPTLVGNALRLIANEYFDRLYSVDPERLARFKRCEMELRVGIKPTFKNDYPTRSPEKYQVQLPWNSQKVLLDMHLGRGNTRNPDRCLRIYFCVNGPDRPIVIGHLPGHLPL